MSEKSLEPGMLCWIVCTDPNLNDVDGLIGRQCTLVQYLGDIDVTSHGVLVTVPDAWSVEIPEYNNTYVTTRCLVPIDPDVERRTWDVSTPKEVENV